MENEKIQNIKANGKMEITRLNVYSYPGNF